eukprot:6213775-Pleurochrysis_carterae.AAC.2
MRTKKRNNLHDSCSNTTHNATEVSTTVQSTTNCLVTATQYTITPAKDRLRPSPVHRQCLKTLAENRLHALQ